MAAPLWCLSISMSSLMSSTLLLVPAVPCQLNLTGPEGYIEAPPQSSSVFHSTINCSYTITVYMGYGVEVQVRAELTSFHPASQCSPANQESFLNSVGPVRQPIKTSISYKTESLLPSKSVQLGASRWCSG